MLRISETTSVTTLIDTAITRVQRNRATFGLLFPNYTVDDRYLLQDNRNWLAAFWPGMVWLAYAQSNDPTLAGYGARLLPSFAQRLDDGVHITHDLGFLFSLSARAQYQLTDDPAAQTLALRAADLLRGRYRTAGRYIQAWGAVGAADEGGRMIIDTMLNLPLLFWAAEQTGDALYADIAYDHATATAAHIVRADGSSYHTFFFDQHDGTPLYGATHQGAADESLWARGQAWGILGFAIAAQWAAQQRPQEVGFVTTGRKMARRFMAELPSDDVPPWDFWAPADAPRHDDSSAGAIALCGLLRLMQVDAAHADEYHAYALRLLEALLRHCWDADPAAQGLLKHGALHVPKGMATDAHLIFGDYFMLEALMLLGGAAPDFWGPPANV